MEIIPIILELVGHGLVPVLAIAVVVLWQRLTAVTDRLIGLADSFEKYKRSADAQRASLAEVVRKRD